ncbi:hypothetical protein [Bradyrhizobium sp. UFLA05-112]
MSFLASLAAVWSISFAMAKWLASLAAEADNRVVKSVKKTVQAPNLCVDV